MAESYRSYRFAWRGQATIPYLIAESHHDRVRLIFNKFGDKYVASYRIYAGENPTPIKVMATADESYIDLMDLENNNRYYFRVTAVNNAGAESNFSNEVYVDTHFADRGDNLLRNGDFSSGTIHWTLDRATGIRAQGDVADSNSFTLDIHSGGDALHDLALKQNDIEP